MNYCVRCNASLPAGSRFCSFCGNEVIERGNNQMAATQPSDSKPAASDGQMPSSNVFQPRNDAQGVPSPYSRDVRQNELPRNQFHSLLARKNYLPLLLMISGLLLLLAFTGLAMLFILGIPSAISEERLSDMGFECTSSQLESTGWSIEITDYEDLRDINTLECNYEDHSYRLYSTTEFKIIYSALAARAACGISVTSYSGTNHRQKLDEFRESFGEIVKEYTLQARQYVFLAKEARSKQVLEDILVENDIKIEEFIVYKLSCPF